jgi:LCP family protein required for cell wall assembly
MTGDTIGSAMERAKNTYRSVRKGNKDSKKGSGKKFAILLILLLVLVVASYGMYAVAKYTALNTPDISSLVPPFVRPIFARSNGGHFTQSGGQVGSAVKESSLKPLNILLLGVDKRPKEVDPPRTDTIIVLHYNPQKHKLGMLSIPRDMWVQIPSYGEGRINTAYRIGEMKKYPGGGTVLVKETVRRFIGYPIDYYVMINFDGFRKLVDLIGGIDVDVPKPINDPTFPDENYGYSPLYIPAGRIHMDGDLALKYARTRHQDSDFGRARRQQQVIMAIRDKVMEKKMLPSLIAKAPQIYKALGNSVSTDMPISLMVALARSMGSQDLTVEQAIIDDSCTKQYHTQGGAWVLLPLRDKVRAVVDKVMEDNPPVSSGTPGATTPIGESSAQIKEQRLKMENARIAVLNGTLKSGLASNTAKQLKKLGFNIVSVGNADRADYQRSILIVYTPKEFTSEELQKIFHIPAENVRTGANLKSSYDFLLILGKDSPEKIEALP